MTIIDTRDLSGRELVAEMHPIGKLSRDHTRQASDELAELVRYLNHVTYADEALPYPIDIDSTVRNIGYALDLLPQLMTQIAARLQRLITNEPLLSTDDGSSPSARAAAAIVHLDNVRVHLAKAAEAMVPVRRETSHLNLKEAPGARALAES